MIDLKQKGGEQMKFQIGQQITLIGVSSMAFTSFTQVTITRELNGKYVIKHKGKRKEYYLSNPEETTLVFEGWDIPFTTDAEAPAVNGVKKFRGNACINLVGNEEIIREYVTTKNINPDFTGLGVIVLIDGDNEKVLFPEIETHHAVIDRYKEKAQAMA